MIKEKWGQDQWMKKIAKSFVIQKGWKKEIREKKFIKDS